MHNLDTGITPTSVQLAVGPVHYAIALRPEDPAQVRTAVDLACRWWGGVSFPWLTLDSEGTVTGGTEQLCSVLDVAGVIDLTRPDDRDPVPAGLRALGVQVTAGDLRPRWAMPIRGVVAPDTSDPLITAGAGEDDDLAEAVAVGTLDPDERDCWAKISQPVSLAQGEESVLAQVSRRTVIGVTATGMETVNAEGLFPTTTALLWVLPDSFTLPDVTQDLVAFWNYRALRLWHSRTVTVMARQSQLREPETRRHLVDAITSSAFSTPMCVVNGFALGDDDLRATANELGFEVMESGTWSERHSSQPEPLKRTAVINVPIATFWMGERHSGTSRDALAVAHRPRWDARIESPLAWRYPEAHQGLVSARITSAVITGPRTESVAALYQQGSRWLSGGVRILTRATPTYRFNLGMPDPAEVLAASLAARGRRFQISDKGREIDGILASCDDLALFRKPAFHALTEMLAHGLVKRGYQRNCQLCGLSELVPLSEATAVPLCAGCGRIATYTSRESEPVLHSLGQSPGAPATRGGRAKVLAGHKHAPPPGQVVSARQPFRGLGAGSRATGRAGPEPR